MLIVSTDLSYRLLSFLFSRLPVRLELARVWLKNLTISKAIERENDQFCSSFLDVESARTAISIIFFKTSPVPKTFFPDNIRLHSFDKGLNHQFIFCGRP